MCKKSELKPGLGVVGILGPPLHGGTNVDWLLVETVAALTYPAVVGQKLGPFLHLLQNLLPLSLRLGHGPSQSSPLIT